MLRDAFDARPLFSRNVQRPAGHRHERGGTRARIAAARIARRGETLVVQEIAPLGVAPVFEEGQFGAKPVSLRVFAAWTPNGWMVMPGGLTRVAADDTVRALSMQSGASSKDAWVLSDAPVDNFSLLGNAGPHASKSSATANPRPAAPWTICSGWAAMPNAPKVWCASCARWRRALGDEPAGALEVARKLLIPFSQASDTPDRSDRRRTGAGRRSCSF